jgi:hypothetical protein
LYAQEFSEGLAAVAVPSRPLLNPPGKAGAGKDKLGRRKYGYIDASGKVVIKPQFCNAGDFSEGLAWVLTHYEEGCAKFGYIDKTGELVISDVYSIAGSFSGGLARVYDNEKKLFGYIDKKGAFASTRRFGGKDFSEAVTAVSLDGKSKWALVDAAGNYLTTAEVEYATRFSEGLMTVKSAGKWCYINKKGETVIETPFDTVRDFSEGLACVCNGGYHGGKWGYIDKTGKVVIEPRYHTTGDFSEGLAFVATGMPRPHAVVLYSR